MYNSLNILVWNAQSILCKRNEFFNYLNEHNIHISLISETWLNYTHKFYDTNFKIHRLDRRGRRCGGVAIIIKRDINHRLLPSLNLKVIEAVSIGIETEIGNLDITAVYYPGPGPATSSNMLNFKQDIQTLISNPRKFIVGGDLNSKHRLWNCYNSNQAGRTLYNVLIEEDVILKYPNSPTYYSANSRYPSTLDLVLTNCPEKITDVKTMQQLSSDHLPVLFKLGAVVSEINTEVTIREYHKADWNLFKNYINSNIDLATCSFINNLNTPTDVNNAIDNLNQVILNAQELSIPIQVKTDLRSDTINIPNATKLLIRLRNIRRRQWQRSRNPNLKIIVNELNRRIKTEIQEIRNLRFQRYVENTVSHDESRKCLWKLSKVLRTKNKCIPTLKSLTNDRILVTNKEKADALGAHFSHVHNLPTHSDPALVDDFESTIMQFNINHENGFDLTSSEIVRPKELVYVIKRLKNSKSPGHDQINNRLVKRLPRKALVFLTYIFNFCLKKSYFPNIWKIGKVIPIPKPGKDSSLLENFRPISLLSIFGKIFERIILHRIRRHLETNEIIPHQQFGFQQSLSTSHQLYRICHSIKQNLNDKKSTAMIFFDVEKAFDKVWHTGLLIKLISFQFPNYIIQIISSYLKDRKFFVQIQKEKSALKSINAGVPQGAVLSPTLFNIYTSDLIHHIPETIEFALYADDTAIYHSSDDINEIMRELQLAIENILLFCKKWLITINEDKTQAIFFTKKTAARNLPNANSIQVNGNPVIWQNTAKYLGVMLDKRLTFKSHIYYAVEKCQKIFHMLYSLLNKNSKLNIENKKLLYTMIIRSILTYGAPVWGNCSEVHRQKLKVIQNKCLKTMYGLPRRFPTSTLTEISNIPMIQDVLLEMKSKFTRSCVFSENILINSLS